MGPLNSMKNMLLIAAIIIQIGCSASPQYDTDPIILDNIPVYCAPVLTNEEQEFADMIFGSHENCDDPEAIMVLVKNLKDECPDENYIGLACRDINEVWLDPSAWNNRMEPITFAHELGHMVGFEHTDGNCDLMNAQRIDCTHYDIEGHSYQSPRF